MYRFTIPLGRFFLTIMCFFYVNEPENKIKKIKISFSIPYSSCNYPLPIKTSKENVKTAYISSFILVIVVTFFLKQSKNYFSMISGIAFVFL